jgi:hypothetical protein
MRLAIVLLSLASAAVAVAQVAPPTEYPGEPDVAVAAFLCARETLCARSLPIGSAELRPSEYIGRPIEVGGQFLGRMTVNAGLDDAWTLLRIALANGQTLSVISSTAANGICEGDQLRLIIEGEDPAGSDRSAEPRFRLRAICLESDFPRPKAALQKAPPTPKPLLAPPASTPAPVPLDVPPSLAATATTVPVLAPYSVAIPAKPRAGKDGAWDPVGNMGFPVVQQAQLDAWKPWTRKLNPRLTDAQADWIVRWVIYYSAANGVDHRLMFAMIKCESDFNPFCVSRAGATGLTQLMPCNVTDFRVSNPWNVQEQIRAGVEHFKEMLDMWRGRSNWDQFALAAASYNAGPNRVKRAGGIPNITETKNYVRKLGDLFYGLCKSGYP